MIKLYEKNGFFILVAENEAKEILEQSKPFSKFYTNDNFYKYNRLKNFNGNQVTEEIRSELTAEIDNSILAKFKGVSQVNL